jgi:hypothetical protein
MPEAEAAVSRIPLSNTVRTTRGHVVAYPNEFAVVD